MDGPVARNYMSDGTIVHPPYMDGPIAAII